MKKYICAALFVLIGLCFSAQAEITEQSCITRDYNIILNGIQLPETTLHPIVDCNIHLKVFVNENNPYRGTTILAVPGYCHTANTWGPFIDTLFMDKSISCKVSRVIAIDMPGHGQSTLSPTASFGNLTLDDYVIAILTSLKRLDKDLHIKPQAIMGHSQGGLIVQMMQQALKKEGTNLKEKFGIKNVVLLAPVVPYVPQNPEIRWNFRDVLVKNAGSLQFFVSSFLIDGYNFLGIIDTEKEQPLVNKSGMFFFLPPPLIDTLTPIPNAWIDFFYTIAPYPVFSGYVSSSAPTAEKIISKGYNTGEPLMATLQLIGLLPIDANVKPPFKATDFMDADFFRPYVEEGIFASGKGTVLQIVSYNQDSLVRPEENLALYKYLTGYTSVNRVIVVEGIESHDTVHDLHVSDPKFLLNSIAKKIELP